MTALDDRMGTEPGAQPGRRAPAPGDLAIVQAFVNTGDVEAGIDRLGDPLRAATWMARHGLVAPRSDLDDGSVRRLIEVREALRALLLASTGEPLDPSATDVLNGAAAEAHLLVGFEVDGTSWLEPAAGGVDGAIGLMLGIVFASMTAGTWSRLKACVEDSCRRAFYDRSKNRSGVWCSMRVCGNRAKTRAYRRRHAGGLSA
ncbi:MAG: CGNR zinc finger domain-containing protein [Acidobacteria bacterium]|nr:CGNR zinc finger domain-containing protein [Acidobacteriota bacterium]